jgi:hypothetical protein
VTISADGLQLQIIYEEIVMISVGIDVSKEKSMVCILKPYGEVILSPFEIMHTEQAVTQLADKILALEGEVKSFRSDRSLPFAVAEYILREENICKHHKSPSDEEVCFYIYTKRKNR